MFENLVKLDLESDEMTANGMISAEGEIVLLKNCVLRGGEVEEWVNFFLLFNTRCGLLKNKWDIHWKFVQELATSILKMKIDVIGF